MVANTTSYPRTTIDRASLHRAREATRLLDGMSTRFCAKEQLLRGGSAEKTASSRASNSASMSRWRRPFFVAANCGTTFKESDETATFLESAQIQRLGPPAAAFQAAPPRYLGKVDDRLDGDDR